MPVSQSQFDADLAAYNTAVTNYIAAVDAFIALPPVIDLAAVAAALALIPQPPGPAAPKAA